MSNTPNNEDDYEGPAWYRPGKNRDLFLGLLVLLLLVGGSVLLGQCDAGREFASRFGFDLEENDAVDDLIGDDGGSGDADLDEFEVTGTAEDGTLTLTGSVPDEDTRNAMVAAAVAELGDGNVVDKIEIDDALADEGTLTLKGEVDEDTLAAAEAAGKAAGDAGDAELDNQLELAEEEEEAAPAQEYAVTGAAAAGALTLTGAVPNEDVRTEMVDAAAAEIGAENVIDELTIDDTLAETGTLTLTGEVDEDVADGIRGAAGAAADAGDADFDDQLEVTAAEVEAPPAEEYAVTGAVEDGVLTLTGSVPDEETRDAMVAAATDELGADAVIDELTIDDTLAETGTLTLTGEVDEADEGAVRSAAEAAADASGADIDDQLTVTAAPPSVDLTSNLNDIVRADPILFEVNSAAVLPESLPIIDQVAEIMNDNPDGDLIVEGHTDSDGDDAGNLQLSQARADSVRNLLVERNVPGDRLTAVGRGETEPVLVDGAEDKDQSRRIEFEINE